MVVVKANIIITEMENSLIYHPKLFEMLPLYLELLAAPSRLHRGCYVLL